jgi:hypothetical protein
VAPTLNVEDIQKRIEELKAVQFWLEQNSRALSATIQALEVQKMTLSTLSAMNVSMGDLASAFQVKHPESKTDAQPEVKVESQAQAEPSAQASTGKDAVDPLAWWGAVTQQFQTIAAQVLKDMPMPQASAAQADVAQDTAPTKAKAPAKNAARSKAPKAASSAATKKRSATGAKRAAQPASS